VELDPFTIQLFFYPKRFVAHCTNDLQQISFIEIRELRLKTLEKFNICILTSQRKLKT
jgi:hypothetical protein